MAYRRLTGLGATAPAAGPPPGTNPFAFIPGAATLFSFGSNVAKAQEAQRRATKLASNIATAQAGGSLADQSFLAYTARTGATRYEYDQAIGSLFPDVRRASPDALRASGLFTEAYINSLSPPPFSAVRQVVSQLMPGSSPANPLDSGAAATPMLVGVGLVAAALLLGVFRRS